MAREAHLTLVALWLPANTGLAAAERSSALKERLPPRALALMGLFAGGSDAALLAT